MGGIQDVALYGFSTGVIVDGPITVPMVDVEIGDTTTGIELLNGGQVDLKNFRHFSSEKQEGKPVDKKKRKGRRKK
jgi:hypothetical protein